MHVAQESSFITYRDLRDKDPIKHFAEVKKVQREVIRSVIKLCDSVGYAKALKLVKTLSGKGGVLSYRDVKYIYKVVKLHEELLSVLRHGAKISEEGIVSRIDGRYDDLIEIVGGERRIRGTYRQLVLRRG